ncbi:NADH:ubiquinone oxidoreductase [Microbotryomycetes sp. JL221]|nr:NADH:ubiquinone oxidoreductase [Microbotryomycetes sp. JL221]
MWTTTSRAASRCLIQRQIATTRTFTTSRSRLIHSTSSIAAGSLSDKNVPPPSSPLSPPPAVAPSPAATEVRATNTAASASTPSVAPIIASSSTSSSSSSSSSYSSSTPPPKSPKKPKQRLRTFARTVLVLVLASGGYIVWHSHERRHPGEQLEFDPKLPTIVVAGNGWGSTAFLKSLDNEGYNVVVISPRNYFLFSPLLPSVTVGTLSARSILEPTRFLTRHKKRRVEVYESEITEVDPIKKTVRFVDTSPIKGAVDVHELSFDYLVYSVGAENNTFGIKGVKEHACFLKEIWDAEKIREKLMDCIESANFAGQSQEEIDRLCSFVVVGGGPTGVEYAGELHDFLKEDLASWYPDIADRIKITLVEALPNVLPMFSKQLIDYTNSTFQENKIDVRTKTMVSEVQDKVIIAKNENKETIEIPYGLLVWATGNTARPVTRDLMSRLPETQNSRRGLLVDEHLRVLGADGIFALGDCTATSWAPTAQAASQQGHYLARVFSQLNKKQTLLTELEEAKLANSDSNRLDSLANAVIRASNIKPFHYSHQGSLAYIGSDKAIADLPVLSGNLAVGGLATYYFWRSAYLSQLFSLRNRILVATDWAKCKVLGRDVSRE